MPRAVSNSSPLIHLAAIKRLELLRRFHDEVLIPPAVWREVVDRASFWINEAVYRRAMAAVGEATDSPEKQ